MRWRPRRFPIHPTATVAALAAAMLVSGCASGARPEGMTVQRAPDAPAQVSGATFDVGAVAGGEETNPLWTSEVSQDAFRTALVSSLRNQGLYDPASGLEISAVLEEVDQPLLGFDVTVTATVTYRVTDASGAVVFDERIVRPYTANFSDAFLGVERLKLANEGAIKTNIETFIERLLKTPFDTGAAVS
jgi:hypothetical protein